MYSTLKSIHEKLLSFDARLVLAESCTAGLVAAELGQIPGISTCFCGSMVVYQTESKTAWLGVAPQMLADPTIGPVSPWASRELAKKLLAATPHATLAAAITGHLGPGAPTALDGKIYFAAEKRRTAASEMRPDEDSGEQFFAERVLQSLAPQNAADYLARRMRQQEAAMEFLCWIDEIVLRNAS